MKKRKRRIILIIAILFIGGLIALLVIKLREAGVDMDKAMEDNLPSTYSMLAEDSGLITSKYLPRIKVDRIIHSKTKNPVSFLLFDQLYHLIIYRIGLRKDTSFKDIFHVGFRSTEQTNGESYFVDDVSDMKFRRLATASKPVSKLYFTIAGDSIKTTVENDSLRGYNLLCHNFSVKYGEEAPIDVFATGEDLGLGRTAIIPMSLLFLKRNGMIYLIVMTRDGDNTHSPIDPSLLYNIIEGV